jgi:hypothetical protein
MELTKQQRLKAKVQEAYDAIKRAEKNLEFYRKVCDHSETENCDYQWGGPGHIFHDAKVCSICGKLLSDYSPFPEYTGEIISSSGEIDLE